MSGCCGHQGFVLSWLLSDTDEVWVQMPPPGQKLPLPGRHYYKEPGCFSAPQPTPPLSLLCWARDEWEERGSEWTLFSNASCCWISNNSPNKTQTNRPLCSSISSLFGLSHQAWQHGCSSVACHMLGGEDGLLFHSSFPLRVWNNRALCLVCLARAGVRMGWRKREDGIMRLGRVFGQQQGER